MYQFSDAKIYGETHGVCRITGKESTGVIFEKWVKDTFTDFAYLKPGTIISNEALFCFEEQSELLMRMTGRDKPQRFRTYSHIVVGADWHLLSKAQKLEIYDLLVNADPVIAVIADSGQKHLLFKHRIGTWQFETETIMRDKKTLRMLKEMADELLAEKFSKAEILTAQYKQYKVIDYGLARWREKESIFKQYRGSTIFDLSIWLSQTKGETNDGKEGTDPGISGVQTAFSFMDWN
jgi:hypothetical protein